LKEASNEAQIEIAKIAAEKEAEYQQSAAKACLLILAAFVVVVVVVRIRSCPASPFLRCSSPEARIRLHWNWNQRRIRSWRTFGH
jgi:hypothetical protein